MSDLTLAAPARDRISDDDIAARRYAQRLAYRRNQPLWCCNLAAHYAVGIGGPMDLARARLWYRLAALQGDARGKYELGLMYLNGEGGPCRRKAGRSLIAQAAGSGDIDALKVLHHGLNTGSWGFVRSKRSAAAVQARLNKLLSRAVPSPSSG